MDHLPFLTGLWAVLTRVLGLILTLGSYAQVSSLQLAVQSPHALLMTVSFSSLSFFSDAFISFRAAVALHHRGETMKVLSFTVKPLAI